MTTKKEKRLAGIAKQAVNREESRQSGLRALNKARESRARAKREAEEAARTEREKTAGGKMEKIMKKGGKA